MHHGSARRPAAWLALAATLASLALPVHAMPAREASASPGRDLCVGGKVVPASPASSHAAHACDACCGSAAPAPPRAGGDRPILAYATVRIDARDASLAAAPDVRLAFARGPPA